MTRSGIAIARSVRWASVAQAGKIAMQLAGVACLTRLLPPSDYGLIAIATAVTAFAALFRDLGTGAALIQRPELDAGIAAAVRRLNVGVGLVLALALAAAAPLVALAFSSDELTRVLWLLAPTLPVSALGAPHQALLERDSRFDVLARVEIAAAALALAVGVTAAYLGFGIYALVAQGLVGATLSTLLLVRAAPLPPASATDWKQLRSIGTTSANTFVFGLANYAHRNADALVIGRWLGAGELGAYYVAYRILLFPLQNLTFVLVRAMFPAYSRKQHRPEEIRSHYVGAIRAIAYLTAPACGCVWALREPLVATLFGPRWSAVAGILAWLVPVALLQSIVSTSGAVLLGAGRSGTLRNLGLAGALFFVLAFFAGLPWGVTGVAAAYCIANVVWFPPVMAATLRSVGGGFRDVVAAVAQPALLGALATAAAAAADAALAGVAFAPARLAGGAAAGVAVWLVAYRATKSNDLQQLAAVMRKGS